MATTQAARLSEMASFLAQGRMWPSGRPFIPRFWKDPGLEDGDAHHTHRHQPVEADFQPEIDPTKPPVILEDWIEVCQDKGHATAIEHSVIRLRGDSLHCLQTYVPLRFRHCRFEMPLDLEDSHLYLLQLKHCRVEFISLLRATVDRSVVVEKSRIDRAFNLRGAKIGRSVALKGSRISDYDDGERHHRAVDLRHAEIDGNLFLRYGFMSEGLVEFSHARIAGKLDCGEGAFHGKQDGPGRVPRALRGRNARIGGAVYLNRHMEARGTVDLRRISVGADIAISDCALDLWLPGNRAPEPNRNREMRVPSDEGRSASAALGLSNATIEQDLKLVSLDFLRGDIDLRGARCRYFRDDPTDWVDGSYQGKIRLNGFTYEAITDPTRRGELRIQWLDRVLPKPDLPDTFPRQPWAQLAKTLARMGYDGASDAVWIEAERRSQGLRIKRFAHGGFVVGLFTLLVVRPVHSFLMDRVLNFGYGQGWMRMIALLMAITIFNIVVFGFVGAAGRMKPVEEEITIHMALLDEALPARHTRYNPFIYGFDVLLPLDLGQHTRWTPMTPSEPSLAADHDDWVFERAYRDVLGLEPPREAAVSRDTPLWGHILLWFPKVLAWANIGFGWLAVILIGAAFAGQFRRDDR